ncbi:bifunctional phosphopantothenoylcysteine decarboxylase/phosphopantothenate--cysteine ligase CoaBC [Elizabethkingia meningoseptica]|uniref:bifunctional phosphopantothenoylcysteine decarboxylase/phosphopantothenate--cysteine ligase CoaBC n=1 Tax=Elizabethkingia meningoseptica TaxID=238 RepID=UPI002011B9AF|nr:bifunctional phosphopantothenoylcysteine decarboxylase/phosphopantothenate--cysteine ligase CoaBC [Elizabethkingia meningoseptica]MCL1677060.1 bifunctional phosphopantothenoylcysteine decarboxylase/phosphopantothenate--cysteine ligase CoaBC [Elizabethkingia meningoseptica]MCL1688039.1 bifunctional phosphopantothenoylcysteine decarboxylase/phosphopantothenate--cysteine ligase CoaBC [Elizabethkingia meningoseptica]
MANSLQGKKILVGVTGGIAAYKVHFLIRDLVKNGAEVQVIMTEDAHQFVTPLSLSTLSRKPVYTDFYTADGTWNNHVELALWADVMLIAPCTANTMAKMATGICDNLLLATYMSAKCPVFVAPAMDLDMYAHPTTTTNLHKLEEFGNQIIPAEEGELASGLTGKGRMAEPETIFAHLRIFFSTESSSSLLKGKTVLITAGPTFEPIDPVRFIGNHSSGKMGFALAEAAADRGAKVILISGPSSQHTTHPNISLHNVISAKEMLDEVFKYYENVDVAIMSAAVADYTPKYYSDQKIKKKEQDFMIELVKNPDILKTMGEKKSHQLLVGFALETQNEVEYAKSKLVQKNLDLIILNSLQDSGAGFKRDTNKVSIFTKEGESKVFELKKKTEVAEDILDVVEGKLH